MFIINEIIEFISVICEIYKKDKEIANTNINKWIVKKVVLIQ